jgi:hypothetical protein
MGKQFFPGNVFHQQQFCESARQQHDRHFNVRQINPKYVKDQTAGGLI